MSFHINYKPFPLHLRHTFTVSGFSRNSTPGVQIRIDFDNISGYGEASMPPYLGESTESVMAFLHKVDLSHYNDLTDLESILHYVDNIEDGNCAAKAAIDIALHDLVGKLQEKALHKLWGLDLQTIPNTTYTIGIDTTEIIKQKTLEYAKDFNILKIKVGTSNDSSIVNAIREVSSLPLSVDANQGWTDRVKALESIHWLKEQGVVMVEQPMPKNQIDDLAWLNQHSPLPIFADESIQRLKDIDSLKGVFSGINIKLMKCTGLNEARKMIDKARSLEMKVMIGCMTESSCAISAAAQISPLADFVDLDGHFLISNDPFEGLNLINGKVIPSDNPGLGIKLKE